MDYTGTMMMDTDWPWIDWINDVWPLSPAATPDAVITVVLLVWLFTWWGHWHERI